MDDSHPTNTEHTDATAVKTLTSTHAKKPRQKRYVAAKTGVITALIVVAGASGYGGSWLHGYLESQTAQPSLSTGVDGNTVIREGENDIAAVVEKVAPSVVSIVAGSGAGTGVIISGDGYVMTNYHVIEGVRDFTVVTAAGQTYDDVSLVGRDPLNDIAFLKIKDASELAVAELGDSGTLRIGQEVIAVGNALGQYDNSVTSGIVSGLGRPLVATDSYGQNPESLTDLIQTDAAINSGNSGGPLVNMAGQVIGINTAMATDANTIGFAIPINATKGVLAGVLEHGKVARAYLGVQYLGITTEAVAAYDLPVSNGAYVHAERGSAVVPDGPAAKAGVKDEDIITKVNDLVIGERGELLSVLGQFRPGDTVKLTVLRDGKPVTLPVKLGDYTNYDTTKFLVD